LCADISKNCFLTFVPELETESVRLELELELLHVTDMLHVYLFLVPWPS